MKNNVRGLVLLENLFNHVYIYVNLSLRGLLIYYTFTVTTVSERIRYQYWRITAFGI